MCLPSFPWRARSRKKLIASISKSSGAPYSALSAWRSVMCSRYSLLGSPNAKIGSSSKHERGFSLRAPARGSTVPLPGREPAHSRSAATMDSTSLQPSSIIEARASRSSFSIGYSRLRPLPPKICSAALATSKAVFVAVTFDATA